VGVLGDDIDFYKESYGECLNKSSVKQETAWRRTISPDSTPGTIIKNINACSFEVLGSDCRQVGLEEWEKGTGETMDKQPLNSAGKRSK
jgi:hypothetical protein